MKLSKRELTQKEIIDSAKEIVKRDGHESITVRKLADESGYSYTNLYYYFKDLNALLWVLRIDMIEDMITELSSYSVAKEDCIDEITNAFNVYIDYLYENPNVFRFFYFYSFVTPDGDDSYQKLEQRFQGIWEFSFLRLIQEKIINLQDLEVIAKTIIYAIQGMIMLSFSSNGTTNRQDIKIELSKLITYLLKK